MNPDPKKMTEAQRFAYKHLTKALHSSPIFRVGVLILSHPATKEEYVCRMASAVIVKQPIGELEARHLITMVEALRDMADTLQSVIDNPSLIGQILTDENMS